MDDKPVTDENNTSQDNVSTQHVASETDGVSGKNTTQQTGSSVDSSELSKVYEIAGLISSALGNNKVLNVGTRDETIIPANNMPVKDNQSSSQSVLETSDYIPVYEKEDTDMTDTNTSVAINDLEKEKDDASQYGSNIEEEDENTNFYDLEGEEADENIKMQSSSHEPSVNEEMISNSEQGTKDFVEGESADTFVLSSSSLEELSKQQQEEYTTDDHGMLPTPLKSEKILVCKIPEPIVREEQEGDSDIFQKKVPSKLIISAVLVCNTPELMPKNMQQDIYRTADSNRLSEALLGMDVTDSQMQGSISQEGYEQVTPVDLRIPETPSTLSMEKEPEEQMVTDNTSEALNEEREQEGEIDFNSSLIAQLDEAKLAAVSIRELCKSMQLEMQERAELQEMEDRADVDEMEERAELDEMEERVDLDEMEERAEFQEMEERAELDEMEERDELQEMKLQAPDNISVEEEAIPTDEKVEDEVTLADEVKMETLVKEMEHKLEVAIQEPSIIQEVAAQEPSPSVVSATNDEPSRSHWQRFLNCILCGMLYKRNEPQPAQGSEPPIQILLKLPITDSLQSLQMLKSTIVEEESFDKKEPTPMWLDPLEANFYSISNNNYLDKDCKQ